MILLHVLLATVYLQTLLSIPEVPVALRIRENVPKDYEVTKLSSHDEAYNYNVIYKLGVDSDLFHIDDTDNSLRTSKQIDVDEICDDHLNVQANVNIECDNEAEIKFNVNVYDKSDRMIKVLKITLLVLDEDDSNPYFDRELLEINVKEIITKANDKLDLLPAIDRDLNESNRYLCYILRENLEIISENDHFKLTVDDGLPRLLVRQELDAELNEKFQLELLAMKSGEEDHEKICNGNLKSVSKPAILAILINVVDINDNQPIFNDEVDSVDIHEDTKPPKQIFTMKARDLDKSSKLEYSLVDKKRKLSKLFQVKPDGKVFLIGELDYEQQTEYNLDIKVTDGDFSQKKNLKIQVLDVNDEKPTFELNPASLSVPEHDLAGKVIGQVTIIDKDSNAINGKVFCYEPEHLRGKQALEFNPDPYKSPNIGKYSLSSRYSFDRETISGSTLSALLVCKDGSENSVNNMRHTSTLTITLTVTDINDSTPRFETNGGEIIVEFHENNQIGDVVTQIKAIDEDLYRNAEVNYSISDNENFEVEPQTGTIKAKRSFDREEKAEYKFLIMAKDQGEPSLSTTTSVLVKILDRNDNSPNLLPCPSLRATENNINPVRYMDEFRRSNAFHIRENLPPGTFIGHILAIDQDHESNANLTYELVPSSGEMNDFEVLSNGTVFSRISLNREAKASYNLLIRVTDNSQREESRVSDGYICIDVDDENDNAPEFRNNDYLLPLNIIQSLNNQRDISFPNDQSYQKQNSIMHQAPRYLTLSKNEKVGFQLLQVEAFDRDSLDNSRITYKIREMQNPKMFAGSNAPLLTIDPTTGIIHTLRLMNEKDVGKYIFNITAMDNGHPPQSTEMGLIVKVEDIPSKGVHHLLSEGISKYIADVPDISWWNDSRNLLVVIILGSVSAVLALVLITAVICLLRPCIKRYNSTCNLNAQCEPLINNYRIPTIQATTLNGRRTPWIFPPQDTLQYPNERDLSYNLNDLSQRNQTYLQRQNDVSDGAYGNLIAMPKFEPIPDTSTDQVF